jgi:hypothetical protein
MASGASNQFLLFVNSIAETENSDSSCSSEFLIRFRLKMTGRRRQHGQKQAAGSANWALRPQYSETLSALGRSLRSEYQPVIHEPIPERLLGLAERLTTCDKSGASHRGT